MFLESDDPWYVKDRKKEEKSARARKRAELQDPLIKMNEFLEKKRKVEESAQEASYKEVRDRVGHGGQEEGNINIGTTGQLMDIWR